MSVGVAATGRPPQPAEVRIMSRIRKLSVPIAFVAGALLAPAVAYAAVGVFSSSTTAPAVTTTNTGGGFALDGRSTASTAMRVESRGTHSGSAAFLRSLATGVMANAVYAKSYATSGEHYGVWGVAVSGGGAGVRGESPGLGVLGLTTTGGAGDGTFGLWSAGDLMLDSGHLMAFDADNNIATPGNLAGLCTVTAGQTSRTCAFDDPLFSNEFAPLQPVVTLTPMEPSVAGLPAYTVSAANQSGFTILLGTPAAGDGVTFAYHVVGVLTTSPGATASTPRSLVRP